MRLSFRLPVLMLLAASSLPAASTGKYRVTVAAAEVDRAGQVVALILPAELAHGAVLHDAAGQVVPLQIDSDLTAQFIVPAQKAGEVLGYTLEPGLSPLQGGVQVFEEPSIGHAPQAAGLKAAANASQALAVAGRLRVSVGGTPVLYYQMDRESLPRDDIDPKFKRGGYLHPVMTPGGKTVTDDYPARRVQEHGIWTSWTNTRFQGRTPDFSGLDSGTVEFGALDRMWSGPVHGGFAAWHRFVDLSAPAPVVALNETWELTVYNVSGAAVPVHMFDLVITQACATPDPLILPKQDGGGLGLCGRSEWLGSDKAFFLTSEGETDRLKVAASRVRWCHLGGDLDDARAGIAVLSHPDNFRAPQPLHVPPAGPELSFAPAQLGEWEISPGKPYVARYRFIVADGAPDRALLDAYWNGFARPGKVTTDPL